jgi:hypothetical protein
MTAKKDETLDAKTTPATVPRSTQVGQERKRSSAERARVFFAQPERSSIAGKVMNVPAGMCARWLDTSMSPPRLAAQIARLTAMGFDEVTVSPGDPDSMYVAGIPGARVFVGDAEIETLNCEMRIKSRKAKFAALEARIKSDNGDALVDKTVGKVLDQLRQKA